MFLRYIHSFRALAIVLVVATHCITLFKWDYTGWPYQLLMCLAPNCTLFFVFISGFLFQHLSHKFQYRRYLKSRWDNVLLPYVMVSLPMIAAQAVTRSGVFDPTYLHHWPTVPQNIAWSLLHTRSCGRRGVLWARAGLFPELYAARSGARFPNRCSLEEN